MKSRGSSECTFLPWRSHHIRGSTVAEFQPAGGALSGEHTIQGSGICKRRLPHPFFLF